MNNKKIKGITKRMVDLTIEDIKRQNKENKKFRQGVYKDVLEDVAIEGNFIDSDSWNNEVESLHSLLIDAAEILNFVEDEVMISYGDKIITLGEMYGQGYYGYIKVNSVDEIELNNNNILAFDTIEDFIESGLKPQRTIILENIQKGLKAVEAIKGEDSCYDEMWEYIKKNLK